MAERGKVEERKNLREVDRRCLVFYLRVFDGTSNTVLGYLVDISEKGIMLVSDGPLRVDKDYRLRMRLPTQMKDRNEIIFTAVSRWCKIDSSSDFYLTGFRLDDLTLEAKTLISNLIEDFGFNGDTEG
jgi:hypothetical protein